MIWPTPPIRPREPSQNQPAAEGHFQSGMAPTSEARLAARQDQKMGATWWSYRLTSRVSTVDIEYDKVASSTASDSQCIEMVHGSSMISTPAKPTATALQRRQPTSSLRISAANPTMNSGAAKE